MKKVFFGLLACVGLIGMSSCSNDDIIADGTAASAADDLVYVQFNVSMDGATRSATDTSGSSEYVSSDSGIESGLSYENTIGSVLIQLTEGSGSDETLVASVFSDDPISIDDSEYIVGFSTKELLAVAGDDVNVYIYCNPASSLTGQTFDADGIYTLGSVRTSEPWASGKMFMSNATAHVATIPSDLSEHMAQANPIGLGTVKVERSVARFDYKDASEGGDNSYSIEETVGVEISALSMINISKSFYYLRRTAADNSGTARYENYSLLGTETANNWIVDTDAADKLTYNGSGLESNFQYSLTDPDIWSWTTVSTILASDQDAQGTYNIWRYATENTPPSIEQQKHGISTGVVFKAKLAPDASSGITLGGGTGGKVYIYGNKLYESWSAVLAAAEDEEANPALAVAVRLVLNDVDNAFDEDDEATLTALAKEGFTTYSQDSDGSYYCYYYYWNKHNDNSATTAGIMEFAVVRNNVYKLSISDIYHYGHPDPTVPNADPDPIDPNGGDEEAESEYYYFTVDVEILPWILRENSMTF